MGLEPFDSEAQDRHPTKHLDCYALGMVIYEVLSLRTPFSEDQNVVGFEKVLRRVRPERPEGADGVWFTDDMWGALEHCWMPEPWDRSSAECVLRCLEKSSTAWVPPSS